MTKKEIIGFNLNKEISLVDTKKDLANITKIIRIYSKEFGIGQYKTSLVLLRQFQQLLTITIHFIKQEELTNEYFDYLQTLSENYLMILNNFLDFTKRIDKDSIPIF